MSAPTLAQLETRLVEAFTARFGNAPAVVAAAPGRVNLIGEHTDYNLGFALPIAIDRHTLVALSETAEAESTLLALDRDAEVRLDLRQDPEPRTGPELWTNYIVGVYEELRHRLDLRGNLNVAVTSTVPIGSGLSSSAALEVATGAALLELAGAAMERLELAKLCQRAENHFVGVPCGLMDQLVSACARAGHAALIDFQNEEIEHVPLPPTADLALLVTNTRVKHNLGATEYPVRRQQCEEAAELLGVNTLREVTPDLLIESRERLAPTLFSRAWHVVGENARVTMAVEALEQGRLDDFGRLMHQSHVSLRDQYEVSCPELDTLVELAEDFREGVHGARMTGGGFGGCTVTACTPDVIDDLTAHLRRGYQERHGRRPAVHVVAAGNGARVLGGGGNGELGS
jgi:galactokinase